MAFRIFTSMAMLLLAVCTFAQTPNPNQIPALRPFEQQMPPATAFAGLPARTHQPKTAQSWHLDFEALKARLAGAPKEFTTAALRSQTIVAFPETNGIEEPYALEETFIMAPELAAKFPQIKTYTGRSLQTPGKTIRLTVSPRGMRAMIVRPDFSVGYVEPAVWGQTAYYLAFEHADPGLFDAKQWASNSPMFRKEESDRPYTPPAEDRGSAELVELRVLRFACTAEGDFSQDHGGTVDKVMAAIVEYTNMANAAYERDIAIRLQLVANNDRLVYLDPDIDPYNGDNGAMANDNILVTNSLIGSNNFDIGHVVRRGGGGVSLGLGIACTITKGGGCTGGSGNGDYGSGFVGVLGQETGHQLDGPHTWNSCGGDGNGQRAGNSAFEPGSGSTIMSYAGGCGGDNVQNFMDLYYHSSSIEVIRSFVTQAFNGRGCGAASKPGNNLPTVTLPYQDGFYIPIKTPFELTGSATDPDNDNITYCWEQMDAGEMVPLGGSAGNSALFRTYPAVTSPTRVFPKLETVLANATDPKEVLPGYARDMTFRLTVRDNHPGVGGVTWQEVAFQVDGNAGPFEISLPSGALGQTWQVGEYERVTWKVANTDKAPINCSKVNIRLSLDNGKTFPILLAENTDNDGSQYVLVPNNVTTLARIRVEAVGNIFFDISNRAFRIAQPTQPTLSMGAAILCLPTVFTTQISLAGTLGFNSPVELSLGNTLPAGAVASFDRTKLNPGETAILRIEFAGNVPKGAYAVKLSALAAGSPQIDRDLTFQTISNNFSDLRLQQPADGKNVDDLTPTLRWNLSADAELYDVQLATSPAFEPSDIVFARSGVSLDSFSIPIVLKKATAYYWRVRPINSCGAAAWVEPNFFSTITESCTVLGSNDLPKTISASGTPTVESKINLAAGSVVKSVSVKSLKFNHSFFRNMEAYLISPQGTEVLLFSKQCGGLSGNVFFNFTDDASTALNCTSLFGSEKIIRPAQPLAALKGQNSTGTWTLRLKDTESSDGGNFQEFKLELCAEVALNPPFLVKNNPLDIDKNANKPISTDFLLAEDANNTPAQLTFTLLTVPQNGHLEKNLGGAMKPGDKFTQADINAGAIKYFDAGFERGEDFFRFSVADGEGGFFGTPKFIIRTTTVGVKDAEKLSEHFDLVPNPTSGLTWVAFDSPVETECRVLLFNTAGQQVKTAILAQGTDRCALELANLPKGVYMVRVETPTGAGIKRLIVD